MSTDPVPAALRAIASDERVARAEGALRETFTCLTGCFAPFSKAIRATTLIADSGQEKSGVKFPKL